MEPRPWYKKKRYIVPATLLGGLYFIGAVSGSPAPAAAPATQVASPVVREVSQPTQVKAETQTSVKTKAPAYVPVSQRLSNDNYYTNVDGNRVHSPAYTEDDSVPPGASARCRDGTYSFSQNRRGTCSHHGGVAEWL